MQAPIGKAPKRLGAAVPVDGRLGQLVGGSLPGVGRNDEQDRGHDQRARRRDTSN